MSRFIAVEMPEQNEGKEFNVVCLVKGANLEDVKSCIFGKGYGIQGYDYGVDAYECDSLENLVYDNVPILDFKNFKIALKQGELTWYKVIEWQKWGGGYVDTEEKLVIINKRVRVSNCFEKCGYNIMVVDDEEKRMVTEVKKEKKRKRWALEIRGLLEGVLGIGKTILPNPSKTKKDAKEYLKHIFSK